MYYGIVQVENQAYLVTFKLMTSQVVQRARLLIMCICVVGGQRVRERERCQGSARAPERLRGTKWTPNKYILSFYFCLSPSATPLLGILTNSKQNRGSRLWIGPSRPYYFLLGQKGQSLIIVLCRTTFTQTSYHTIRTTDFPELPAFTCVQRVNNSYCR